MKYKSFAHMNCSVAQSLEILGERWTLLILRDAFLGTRKFEDFLGTGISRNVLAARLKRLLEEGILEKRPIDGKSSEYRLTLKGLDLQPVLLSLMHWGDQHLPHPAGDRLI
ncbi:MAG: helix-turn-helix domain-containing protein, partial [Gammaproteobacteria bacterium]